MQILARAKLIKRSKAHVRAEISHRSRLGDSPQSLQTFQHVSLDAFVLLVALQQRDGIVVVLAVDLVHLLQLSLKIHKYLSCDGKVAK